MHQRPCNPNTLNIQKNMTPQQFEAERETKKTKGNTKRHWNGNNPNKQASKPSKQASNRPINKQTDKPRTKETKANDQDERERQVITTLESQLTKRNQPQSKANHIIAWTPSALVHMERKEQCSNKSAERRGLPQPRRGAALARWRTGALAQRSGALESWF